MEKHSPHYARRFSVEQNCEVAAAIAWSESRSYHLSRQKTESFHLNVFHSNGPFPTGINLFWLVGHQHPIANSSCYALGYSICLMYKASQPHILKAEENVHLNFCSCIHFLHPASPSWNTVIAISSSTCHTDDSAPPCLLPSQLTRIC